ncbi:hypothetical protein OSTOST_19604 [Ostertagia ostertagi]
MCALGFGVKTEPNEGVNRVKRKLIFQRSTAPNVAVARKNNPDVSKRMKAMGIKSTHDLLDYYWRSLFGLIDKARPGTKKIVWQEVLDLNVNASDAIAHVWKGKQNG